MRNTTPRSGISKTTQRVQPEPAVPPYPTMLPFCTTPEIKNVLCYVLRHYGVDGLSISVVRKPVKGDVNISIMYGNWRGVRTDLESDTQDARAALFFQDKYLTTFLETMRLINIQSAQFYAAVGKDDLILTDIRLGPTKLTGPGMVRDIFGKLMRTPEMLKLEVIDDAATDAINRGFGSYTGDLIIKPSKFRTVERPELGTCPLLVEVRR